MKGISHFTNEETETHVGIGGGRDLSKLPGDTSLLPLQTGDTCLLPAHQRPVSRITEYFTHAGLRWASSPSGVDLMGPDTPVPWCECLRMRTPAPSLFLHRLLQTLLPPVYVAGGRLAGWASFLGSSHPGLITGETSLCDEGAQLSRAGLGPRSTLLQSRVAVP